jgi:hypothetical protein
MLRPAKIIFLRQKILFLRQEDVTSGSLSRGAHGSRLEPPGIFRKSISGRDPDRTRPGA